MRAPVNLKNLDSWRERNRWVLPDKEWLEHQYLILDKSRKTIARETGAGRNAVLRWFEELGVPIRTRAQIGSWYRRHARHGEDNPSWSGGLSRGTHKRTLLRAGVPKRCAWCGCEEDVQLHHKDHNSENGSLENLIWLCRPCHLIEWGFWYLVKEGRVNLVIKGHRLIADFLYLMP